MLTIEEFFNKHKAYDASRTWAIRNCSDMNDVWLKIKPEWLLWIVKRPGVLTDRELSLFTVFCLRQISHILTDKHIQGIEIFEQYVNGKVGHDEFIATYPIWFNNPIWDAARTIWSTEDARNAQAAWLRSNTVPSFE